LGQGNSENRCCGLNVAACTAHRPFISTGMKLKIQRKRLNDSDNGQSSCYMTTTIHQFSAVCVSSQHAGPFYYDKQAKRKWKLIPVRKNDLIKQQLLGMGRLVDNMWAENVFILSLALIQ